MSSGNSRMIILGIDPGLAATGWGAIEKCKVQSAKCKVIDFGVIRTSTDSPLPQRLSTIYKNLRKIIKKCKPDLVAVETLFFGANAKTAMTVGQVQGTVILAAGMLSVPVRVYPPLQVKMSLTGYGRSKKAKMQKVVKKVLKLKEIPRPNHAADALAVALCCAKDKNMVKFNETPR